MMSDDDMILPTPWALEAAYMSKARDEVNEQQAQLAADAARYRWLKDQGFDVYGSSISFRCRLLQHLGDTFDLDSSIDAAIDSLKEGET